MASAFRRPERVASAFRRLVVWLPPPGGQNVWLPPLGGSPRGSLFRSCSVSSALSVSLPLEEELQHQLHVAWAADGARDLTERIRRVDVTSWRPEAGCVGQVERLGSELEVAP